MAAYQAPLSLGFSKQEHWSGLPFPSPMHESEKWKWSRSVVSDSSQPHGLQPTRLPFHGIFQARVLEWVAIAFSHICLASLKWNLNTKLTHLDFLLFPSLSFPDSCKPGVDGKRWPESAFQMTFSEGPIVRTQGLVCWAVLRCLLEPVILSLNQGALSPISTFSNGSSAHLWTNKPLKYVLYRISVLKAFYNSKSVYV